MEPWNSDGSVFDNSFLKTFAPVSNEQVAIFLDADNTRRTVLVAPKGYGKTLLLKKRASDIRRNPNADSVCIHPSNVADSVEYLRINSLGTKVTDWEWVKRVDNQQEWSNLWCYAIGFLVCYNEGKLDGASPGAKDVLAGLNTLFDLSPSPGKKYSVSAFLSMMLDDWDRGASRYSKFYSRYANPLLDDLSRLHILFLDSPDEALNFDKSDVYADSDVTPGLWGALPEQWIHFQMGLVYAIRRIRQSHKNIRVFATLRTEALNGARTELRQQLRELCVQLDYSAKDLREIFEQNIRRMAESPKFQAKLVSYPLTDQLIASFAGISSAWHYPTQRDEDLFEAIYRHTRGSPRDIVEMGALISKIDVETRRRMTSRNCDELRAVIDAGGKSFFENQKIAAIPRWHPNLDDFLLKFRTNVIHRSAVREISPSSNRKLVDGCPFDYIFSQGLFGWVGSTNVGGVARSTFLTGSELSSRDRMLPESDWYVLHPVIYPWLRERHGDGLTIGEGYLSSHRSIVGNGLEMEQPSIISVELDSCGAELTVTGARSLRLPVTCASSVFFLCLLRAIVATDSNEIDLTDFERSQTAIKDRWRNNCIPGQNWDDLGKTLRATFNSGYHGLTNRVNEWLRLAFGVNVTPAEPSADRQKRVSSGPVSLQRDGKIGIVRMLGVRPSDVRFVVE